MTEPPKSGLITLLLGVLGSLMTAGIVACATMLFTMGNRLTAIEATMAVNKTERVSQYDDLAHRVGSLEDRVFHARRR